MALGVEQAGFDVVAAVEIDPIHAATHKRNFPSCIMINQDAAKVTGEMIRDEAGLAPDEQIHLVTGGPPCQGFSVMGKQQADDPRSSLINVFARLVDELQPEYFIFENVKGLTGKKFSKVLGKFISDLKKSGYKLIEPYQVLNAKDFKVPQHRERLIIIGALESLPLPHYPEPRSYQPTCVDALGDLPDLDHYDELLEGSEVEVRMSRPTNPYQEEMRNYKGTGWHNGYKRDWDRGLLTCSARTRHSLAVSDRFSAVKPGQVDPISHFFRLHPDGISPTLRAGTDAKRGAFTSPRPIHYKRGRCISVREMMRLHGFPDWFKMHHTKWHGARQVGNAVPPPMARAIAGEIVAAAGYDSSLPDG